MSDKNLPLVLTLDAGGTNFVFSAIQNYKSLGKEVIKNAYHKNLDDVIASILSGFQEVADSLTEEPEAISFAFPGPADYKAGIIGDLFNLPAFRGDVPLKNIIEEKFNIPVSINNDGDLFTLGEAEKGFLPFVNSKFREAGSQKAFKNLFGVTLGTGFGGGCVIDKRLLLGDNSSASEVWLFSNSVYSEYNAESSVGIKAIKREYALLTNHPVENVPEPSDIYKIAKGEIEGNKEAAKTAFNKMGTVLGNVLTNISTVVDGLIVIGGGLAGAYDLFIDSVLDVMRGEFKQFGGDRIPRLAFDVYDLENKNEREKFLVDDIKKIETGSKHILYDRHKRIGIGKSVLGTSKAVSIGAYKFALSELGCDK